MFRAAKEGLTRWLGRARDVVMTPWRQFKAPPNPDAIASTQPLWQAQVDRILRALTPAQIEGWAAAHLPGDYDPQDPYIQANLALTYNLLVRIPDEVHAMVIGAILQGANQGQSTEQIAKRVDDILTYAGSENWSNRAKVIAQTECLPGDSIVDAAVVTHAYRRRYEGDLVTVVSENGLDFSGTPNHPVLTTRGWVALGELMEGDCLVRDYGSFQQSVLATDPDIQTPPTTLAKIFDAIQAVGVVERVTGGQPDFHGDGRNGDVDIAATNGPLLFGDPKSSILDQKVIQLILEGALLGLGLEGNQSHLFRAHLLIHDASRLTHGPGFDACLPQSATEGCWAHIKISCEFCGSSASKVLGQYRDDVHTVANGIGLRPNCRRPFERSTGDAGQLQGSINDGLRAVEFTCHGGRGPSDTVLLDRVSKIVVTQNWAHLVYNLSTVDGYFVSNGVYTKNCNRHFNGSMLAHGLLREKAGDSSLMKRWDTVMDGKERLAHQEANNQPQPLSQPFIVDGEPLLFPGDPTGRPSNVINCRCSLRLQKAGS